MAVAPTGAIYKALKFDGVSSRTYGVYITGEAVYNAPKREVEMVAIPGRNGAFALDKGRFENIEVTYPAGIFAETEADFRNAISEFRNFLCSRNGYVRLSDEYNPNEYRMAIYKSGLEVEPSMLKAGQFDIVFDCKPQRWLTSGEVKQTIASSGDTVTNPTLFEASPVLEVEGYGKINLPTGTVEIIDDTIGEVLLSNGGSDSATLDKNIYNVGDAIYGKGAYVMYQNCIYTAVYVVTPKQGYRLRSSDGHDLTQLSGGGKGPRIIAFSFIAGTADQNTYSYQENINVHAIGSETMYPVTVDMAVTVSYDGDTTISASFNLSVTGTGAQYVTCEGSVTLLPIYVNSTKNSQGHPSYIDLDIGEAYKYESGSIVSINNTVNIPAVLPTLLPSGNEITFDNTITDLQIVPRWWKV